MPGYMVVLFGFLVISLTDLLADSGASRSAKAESKHKHESNNIHKDYLCCLDLHSDVACH